MAGSDSADDLEYEMKHRYDVDRGVGISGKVDKAVTFVMRTPLLAFRASLVVALLPIALILSLIAVLLVVTKRIRAVQETLTSVSKKIIERYRQLVSTRSDSTIGVFR
jgi:hypothetical protein